MCNKNEKICAVVSYFAFRISGTPPCDVENVKFYDILYLADWYFAIRMGKGRTITDATWRRGTLGPYCEEIAETCKQFGTSNTHELRFAKERGNMTLRFMNAHATFDHLSEDERAALDHAINAVHYKMDEQELDEVVFGTLPLLHVEMNADLDVSGRAVQHARIHGYFDESWESAEIHTCVASSTIPVETSPTSVLEAAPTF